MTLYADRIRDTSLHPCYSSDEATSPSPNAAPRRHNVTLMLVSAVAVLLLLSNMFLGYHFYLNTFAASPAPSPFSADGLTGVSPTFINEEETLTQLYEDMEPSVVKIIVVREGEIDPSQADLQGDGLGSGVIFDDQGLIVTNRHVVAGVADAVVKLASGRIVKAEILGQDPGTDLAVLEIDVPEEELTAASFVDSNALRVGQVAVAIGHPFGLEKTLTVGHVSGLNRETPTKDKYKPVIQHMIQTDAVINPGNSGGPLLNLRGEVMGINTTLFSFDRGWQGVGFAVPSNTVRDVAAELVEKGYVSRPYVGIVGISLNAQRAKRLGIAVDHGVLIQEVSLNSPAREAGVQSGTQSVWLGNRRVRVDGDILVAVDGRPVDSMETLSEILQARHIGDTLTLKIQRDGEEIELTVTVSEQPVNK